MDPPAHRPGPLFLPECIRSAPVAARPRAAYRLPYPPDPLLFKSAGYNSPLLFVAPDLLPLSKTMSQRLFPTPMTTNTSCPPPRSLTVVPLPRISLAAGPVARDNDSPERSPESISKPTCGQRRPLFILSRSISLVLVMVSSNPLAAADMAHSEL